MQPEYPPWFDCSDEVDWHIVADGAETEDDGIPCGMLRTGMQCGNDAYLVIAYHRPHDAPAFLTVCRTCAEELQLEEDGATTTAYWREKQREWRVR